MHYACDHVHLRSRDAVRAAAFYVATFGAREVKRVGADPVQRVVLDLGGLTVFIEQAPAETAPAGRRPASASSTSGCASTISKRRWPISKRGASRSGPESRSAGRACGSPSWRDRTGR